MEKWIHYAYVNLWHKNGKRKTTQIFDNLRVIMRVMKLLSLFPFSDFLPPNFDMMK